MGGRGGKGGSGGGGAGGGAAGKTAGGAAGGAAAVPPAAPAAPPKPVQAPAPKLTASQQKLLDDVKAGGEILAFKSHSSFKMKTASGETRSVSRNNWDTLDRHGYLKKSPSSTSYVAYYSLKTDGPYALP